MTVSVEKSIRQEQNIEGLKMTTIINPFQKKSNSPSFKSSFSILNDRGLHTRPATEIVKCASKFKSEIRLIYRKDTANAKSILGILMFAAPKGAEIAVEAVGVDAEQAVIALKQLAAQQFYMNY